MKYKIIACFDALLEAFMPPQAVNDMLDEDIVESNRRAVVNGTIPVDKAKRLILYKVGTFDDKTGEMTVCRERLADLASFCPRTKTVVEEKTNGQASN